MELQQELARKLNPNRFTAMSGKMAAIVGYLIGERFTNPGIRELIITSDGTVLAVRSNDVGANDTIGDVRDLDRNLSRLIKAAELTPVEAKELRRLRRGRVTDWRSKVVGGRRVR
jgi:hypothetical protein